MFIGSNLLRKGGSHIYQPFKALGQIPCNVTTYYNTTTMETISVPFVPCGQAYVNGDKITVNGLPMVVLGE